MGPQTIQGNQKIATAIRERRKELRLTIEEAAAKAGVGTKTWCRYEAGESIRKDKYRGVCKALNWRSFPEEDAEKSEALDISEYKNHKAWSQNLADIFGDTAAASFAIGSDILLDHIEEDLRELSRLPKGTHIGQLDCSFLTDKLPRQFLMRFDYDFMYTLRMTVIQFRMLARLKRSFVAHSVLEELALYLVVEESRFLLDEVASTLEEDWDTWIFDLFDDQDVVTFLYSNIYVSPEHIYHFDHWQEQTFYME